MTASSPLVVAVVAVLALSSAASSAATAESLEPLQGFVALGPRGACRGENGREPSHCSRIGYGLDFVLLSYDECAGNCARDAGCNAYMYDSRRFCVTYTDSPCPGGMRRVNGGAQPVSHSHEEPWWTCFARSSTTSALNVSASQQPPIPSTAATTTTTATSQSPSETTIAEEAATSITSWMAAENSATLTTTTTDTPTLSRVSSNDSVTTATEFGANVIATASATETATTETATTTQAGSDADLDAVDRGGDQRTHAGAIPLLGVVRALVCFLSLASLCCGCALLRKTRVGVTKKQVDDVQDMERGRQYEPPAPCRKE